MPKLSPTEQTTIIPWRERPLLTIQEAAQIAGVSTASIYGLANSQKLSLKRITGRTLVQTPELIEVIESAEDWAPSDRGSAARAAKVERAQSDWPS
jgi:predicted DNA-binding transcriptional regulator AlpA